MTRPSRRGFTLIELMVVVVIMGILASVAVLKYIDLTDKARTAKIAEEINAIRLAAYNHWADSSSHAVEKGAGVMPPEFRPWLGPTYSFDHTSEGYVLDWDNFGAGGGGYQVGVTVTAVTPRMERALARIFTSQYPFFRAGNSLTYVIVGPDGTM